MWVQETRGRTGRPHAADQIAVFRDRRSSRTFLRSSAPTADPHRRSRSNDPGLARRPPKAPSRRHRAEASSASILPVTTARFGLRLGAQRLTQLHANRRRFIAVDPSGAAERRHRVSNIGTPNCDAVLAGWRIFHAIAATEVGLAEIWSVRHIDVSDHDIVDIAPEHDESRPIESDRRMNLTFVERKLKAFGRRERVDLVAHAIVVRKLHAGAGCDDEYTRSESKTALIHHRRSHAAGGHNAGTRRCDGHYSVSYGMSIPVNHRHPNICRFRERRAQRGQCKAGCN